MKDKVVVTGGAGFIGSHLVRALVPNYSVVVIDDFSSGKAQNLRSVRERARMRIVRGDVRDRFLVKSLTRKAEAIFHLAARPSVPRSIKNPVLTNSVNVDGTLNVLKCAVDNHVSKFVYSSSSSVYGESLTRLKKEELPPRPISPYAVSKLAGENYATAFYHTYGLPTVSLRYFNVYGPKQAPGPYAAVITSFVNRLLAGKPPIIFGDGKQARDFTFVSDVVQANLLAMNRERAIGEVLNVGTGRATSINDLAELAMQLCAKQKVGIIRGKSRVGDIKRSCADISKAKRVLGYSPQVQLRAGLRTVVAWLRETGR
jgi:UDP-glucose 4-epimerase